MCNKFLVYIMFLFRKANLDDDLRYFLAQNYEGENSFKTLIKLLLSFGLYMIFWFYKHSSFFKTLDKQAPEPLRGAFILFIIPVSLYLLETLLILLLPELLGKILYYNFYFLWAIWIFLSLKFIYDFCCSFARVTNTSSLFWYILLYLGYFPVLFLSLGIKLPFWTYLSPLLAVFLMQALLNRIIEEELLFEEKNSFNRKPKTS